MKKPAVIIRIYLLALGLAACESDGPKQTQNQRAKPPLDIVAMQLKAAEAPDTTDYDNATYSVVIIDTGRSYSELRGKMFRISRNANLPIDTMGRYFNKKKDLIALPDNDADEQYAGDFFPRRIPSEFLSLEYLDFYQLHARAKTMALVAGLYESEQRADSALYVLNRLDSKAFKVKAAIFVGCTR